MISDKLKDKLKANWSLAESMSCKAELRVYDPLSDWQCYVLAMNDDDIACIVSTNKWTGGVLTYWKVSDLECVYNSEGEKPIIDHEYRPIQASQLFKQLNGGSYDS